MKKQEIEGNFLSPLPAVLVGAQVNGIPNYLVIGYICPFDFGTHIFFSLYKKRYTQIGIHEHRTFSVNIPSEEILAKFEICGSNSGRDFNKSTLFDNFYGVLKTAPMIHQCPINMECEVVQILDYDPNEGIIGRVVKSYVDPQYLTGEKINWQTLNPFIWTTGGDFSYYRIGEKITPKD